MATRYKSPLLQEAPPRRHTRGGGVGGSGGGGGGGKKSGWLTFSIVANVVLCLGFVYLRTPSLPSLEDDPRRATTTAVMTEGASARRTDVDDESMRVIHEAGPGKYCDTHVEPSLLEVGGVPMTWRTISARPVARHVVDTHLEPSFPELYSIL